MQYDDVTKEKSALFSKKLFFQQKQLILSAKLFVKIRIF